MNDKYIIRSCVQAFVRRRPGSTEHAAGGGRVRRRSARTTGRQDGQRAAAGARAASLGADSCPPPQAPLGPALFSQGTRCARRRCEARHHFPKGDPDVPRASRATRLVCADSYSFEGIELLRDDPTALCPTNRNKNTFLNQQSINVI